MDLAATGESGGRESVCQVENCSTGGDTNEKSGSSRRRLPTLDRGAMLVLSDRRNSSEKDEMPADCCAEEAENDEGDDEVEAGRMEERGVAVDEGLGDCWPGRGEDIERSSARKLSTSSSVKLFPPPPPPLW